mgnify:CR=1 FL=1
MAKKKITIEDLAVMVKQGFDHTVTHEEFQQEIGGIKKEMGGIKNKMGTLEEQIIRLSSEVSRLREDVHRDDPFVEDLLRRMREVEKRMGITR